MRLMFCFFVLFLMTSTSSWGDVLTFEGLQDLQPVDQFYNGVTFSHAVGLIAGFSLNDAEFPPASGNTVVTSDGADMKINWAAPVTNFTALVTHASSITLEFFLAGVPVGDVTSVFQDNLALSGDPGSTPNEAISFGNGAIFDSVEFETGDGFTVDDVSFDKNATQSTPEPATVSMLVAGFLLVSILAMRRSRRRDSLY